MAAWIGPSLGLALSRGPQWLAPGLIAVFATYALAGLIRSEEPRKACTAIDGPLPRSEALYGWTLILRSGAIFGPLGAVLL